MTALEPLLTQLEEAEAKANQNTYRKGGAFKIANTAPMAICLAALIAFNVPLIWK